MFRQSIDEIYDLNTTIGATTILKFHTPQDKTINRHLYGLFLNFRKIRYLGTSIRLVPAATLPLDPLQVSYEVGEDAVDPRDQLNPILHRSYRGEALLTDGIPEYNVYGTGGGYRVTGNTEESSIPIGGALDLGQSANRIQLIANNQNLQGDIYAIRNSQLYSACLMDKQFKKSHIQAGVKAYGKPLARPLASNYPYQTSGYPTTLMGASANQSMLGPELGATSTNNSIPITSVGDIGRAPDDGSPWPSWPGLLTWPPAASIPSWYSGTEAGNADIQMFSNGYQPLGWMDTAIRSVRRNDPAIQAVGGFSEELSIDAFRFPKVYTYLIMMPPAYKQKYFFRMILTHHVAFAGFRSCHSINAAKDRNTPPLQTTGISNFVYGAVDNAEPVGDPGYPAQVSHPDPIYPIEVEGGEITKVADGVSG